MEILSTGTGFNRRYCRVDPQLNCIKGGGACQLREKVLAEAATTCVDSTVTRSLFFTSYSPTLSFVVVADFRKNVECLGTNVRPNFCALTSCSLTHAGFSSNLACR
jgi:hypothetical protein